MGTEYTGAIPHTDGKPAPDLTFGQLQAAVARLQAIPAPDYEAAFHALGFSPMVAGVFDQEARVAVGRHVVAKVSGTFFPSVPTADELLSMLPALRTEAIGVLQRRLAPRVKVE